MIDKRECVTIFLRLTDFGTRLFFEGRKEKERGKERKEREGAKNISNKGSSLQNDQERERECIREN